MISFARNFSRHELAWIHFYPAGNGHAKKGYVLHHKDETLKKNNPKRYNQWNIEDLVMIPKAEHLSLHHKGKKMSLESRQKLSKSKKGKPAWNKGIPSLPQTIEAVRKARNKRVTCLTDGRTFESAVEAANFYGIHAQLISMVCRGVRPTTDNKVFQFA